MDAGANHAKTITVLVASLLLLELALHFLPAADPYLAPEKVHKFLPSWNAWNLDEKRPPFSGRMHTGRLHGVSTTAVEYRVNRLGFLYDEPGEEKAPNEIRIAVIGGSTVECIALEHEKRWPEIVQALLANQMAGERVSVFNFGVSGQDTRTHLATTAQLAIKLDLDVIVFMLGANDLFRAREDFDALTEASAFVFIDQTQGSVGERLKWWLTRSQIVRRARQLRNAVFALGTEDDAYFRKSAADAQALPALEGFQPVIGARGLEDYETNAETLAGIALAHGVTPVFTTQPMLWKRDMPAEERAVDWLAVYPHRGRLFRLPGELSAQLLGQLNDRLQSACAAHGWICIDLASSVPRDLAHFYDSVHFNEAGARLVAEQVARALADALQGRRRRAARQQGMPAWR